MTVRRLLSSLAVVAAAFAMAIFGVPSATADSTPERSTTAAGQLDCTYTLPSDSISGSGELWCSYGGRLRGVLLLRMPEPINKKPHALVAWDRARDHRGVVVYARWSGGKTVRVRTAGGLESKYVRAPRGTTLRLQMCLDGGICSWTYYYKI
jgi:hypothetical protein